VEIDYGDDKLSVVDDDNFTNVRKAIASGYFYNTAKLQEKSGTYKPLKHANNSINVHPSSSLIEALPKWVIYNELVFTTKEFMRDLIEIDPSWLLELAPHYYKESDLF
jgi:pre-mRNA-splicing factor ATP-dependent RNA helicase DHX16